MSVDLSQFHQVFFEESFEGLDAMESALMELDPVAVDSETINTIFRAAHSIKGGSATFGFTIVAEFTHVLETLLDEIRDGTRSTCQEHIDLFLQSVDCLRDLLTALQGGEEPDPGQSTELRQAFEAILGSDSGGGATAAAPEDVAEVAVATAKGWKINFCPNRDTFRTGNEPLRIFQELGEQADVKISSQLDKIPEMTVMDPESCYIGFTLELSGDIDREGIDAAFEWVSDEAIIEIEEVEVTASSAWKIYFKPEEDILLTGNEPLRIFRELAESGECTASCHVDAVPEFSALEPTHCYLAWDLQLESSAEKDAIDEAFEWVVDSSELTIDKPAVAAPAAAPAAAAAPAPAATTSAPAASAPASPAPAAEAGAADASKPAMPKAPKPKKISSADTSSIRVGIDKVDSLINMVGELVITQSMLGQLGSEFEMENLPKLLEGLSQLEHNTRELQESVMRIRMLPISFAFSRFPRMVRDLSRRLNKQIELKLLGEQTELDKTVMEKIGDPLVHLVRNALDHGIEVPEERVAAGKPEMGTVTLNAYHQGGNVVIEIKDDGKGLDREKLLQKGIEKGLVNARDAALMPDDQVYDLIFQPGFSTAKEVSDVSGRGVGMDVVRRNIQELNGTVEITSNKGKGSRITIRLPLTLAILDGQLVHVGGQTYIFPLVSIVESLQSKEDMVRRVAGGCDVLQLREEYVPIIRLHELFNIRPQSTSLDDSLLVVVEYEGEKVGVVVDDLQAQQQVVIKSLEQNYQPVEGVSGATILGDGTVALILDIPGLVKLAGINHQLHTRVASLGKSHRDLQQIA